MKHIKSKLAAAALTLGALTAFSIFACDTRLKIQNYRVDSHKIVSHVRAVLLSDLHSCYYGENEIQLTEAIDSLNPDLIFMSGDICDDNIPHDNTEKLLKNISEKYRCYYVTGNHEYLSEDIDTILELFNKYHVVILEGECKEIEVKGQKLNICGLSDPKMDWYYGEELWEKQAEQLNSAVSGDNFTILLSHRPELISYYSSGKFDLVLSGHAHGGQWIVPGIMNGLYAPNQGFFPKYAGGEYELGDAKLIVSRGLAKETTLYPRIFNRPELVVIDLD